MKYIMTKYANYVWICSKWRLQFWNDFVAVEGKHLLFTHKDLQKLTRLGIKFGLTAYWLVLRVDTV